MTPALLDDILNRVFADPVLTSQRVERGRGRMTSPTRLVLTTNFLDLYRRQCAVPIPLPGAANTYDMFTPLRKRLLDVVTLRSQPQVIRAYTQRRITVVQDEQPIGDLATEQDVRGAVGRNALTLQPEPSVPLGSGTIPQPASLRRFVRNQLPKARAWISQWSWSSRVYSCWHDGTIPQVIS